MSWTGYILLALLALTWGRKLWIRARHGPASVRAARMVLRHEEPEARVISARRIRQRHRDFVGLHALGADGSGAVRVYEVDRESLRVRAVADPTELPKGWAPGDAPIALRATQ